MSQIQSIIFDKNYYSLSKAKKWLKKNNFITDLDEKPLTYRFRQLDPKIFNKLRTMSILEGIKFIVGYI